MKKYKVAMYLRLSREDDKNTESESISNQRLLIKSFLKKQKDLKFVCEKVDDGYSGSNFERPAFKELMEDVKNGKVDCIIVKDFSRFGRNFTEVGRYIQEIFPFMGVRFISINDNYDSIKTNSSEELMIPFKNLLNDAFLRDISTKIRTQLDAKRQNGDFIGSFATYGYLKDPDNKNKLVVDEYASKIVEQIFKLKLEGYTHNKIAEKLNDAGILCPMEYKKHIGLNFKSGFKTNGNAKWNHNTIIRILKNPIYIGVLEQGKSTTLNYKTKIKVQKEKEKWLVCENNHEPIIDKNVFDNVQKLMLSDTRVAPNTDKVALLSGLLFCGDCGRSLVRKNYGTKDKRYIYYVCSGAVNGTGCTKHSTRDIVLEETILKSIKMHIKILMDTEKVLETIKNLPYTEREIKKIDSNINDNKKEIALLQEKKLKVYEDFKDEILDESDYFKFRDMFQNKIDTLKKSIENFEEKIHNLVAGNTEEQEFIQYFKKYKNIEKLDRNIVVALIEKIYVYEDLKIEIKFKFDEQYEQILSFIKNMNTLKGGSIDG